MVISLTIEDMVCEEYEGHVNVYSALYYILQRSKVSLPHLFKNYGALRTARRLWASLPPLTYLPSPSLCPPYA
jgi:hypothetical protein